MPELTCSCDSKRSIVCGFTKTELLDHPKHQCPYITFVFNNPTSCTCCPLCTLLCLPRKFLTRNQGNYVTDCYDLTREILRLKEDK